MRVRSLAVVMLLVAGLAAPVVAADWKVSKDIPFDLDKWVDLGVKEGPVTLHRIRVTEVTSGGVFKPSELVRPLNPDYLKTVRIELEYSNGATRDWETRMIVEWFDSNGVVIDGFKGDESLDDSESHDQVTVTWATLKYGLLRAKSLKINLDVRPD